jgi:uncharacterized protein YxeA
MKKLVKYLLICFFSFFVVATTWSIAKTDTRSSYMAEESDSEDTDQESTETEEETTEEEKADAEDSWRYEEDDSDDSGSEDAESYRLEF